MSEPFRIERLVEFHDTDMAGIMHFASFFHYMGLAGQRAAPRKRTPLPRLVPEHLPGLSVFTQRYFENLFGRLKPGSAMVLDDYQKVPAESPFHEVIRDGLSRLPEGINALVIIGSSTDRWSWK